MSDVTSDQGDDDDVKKGGAKPAVVLARAIWRDQLKERGIDTAQKETVKEDWKGKKPQYLALARRIIRHLGKAGFALEAKAEASTDAS